ncbi:DUF779 domain-containing protein [Campylobacter sp. MIT 99-7217]|uniref:DUF779 domain-containing protein n=1 Tax=Campylobacter sp. MIT 99-7217 TaxID=535091 RepID=UPI0011578F54|nr:DUF779 domain-containing protein [Campylobacter sp. MIT 99-7217]TQR31266.1 DUF779 domain-containing protein [Campylobacter sp. MIT 99-7217]
MQKIQASKQALDLLEILQKDYTNGILLYLSGGCCEGSALLCYEKDDFKIGINDELLAEFNGVKLYTHKNQLSYLQTSQLSLEVLDGNGSEFSLEYGLGKHFILQSQICKI